MVPRCRGDLAAVGFQLAGEDAEESGLARPVAADEADTVPRREPERRMVEQHAVVVAEDDLLGGQDGRGGAHVGRTAYRKESHDTKT